MATVTSCPRCSEKLRLPDELRGQKVRCPQCSNIFEAADSSAPPPPPPPPRAAGLDVPLNLSLDDPDPVPADAAPRSKTVGAVEINPAPADAAPEPEPVPPPSRADRPRDRNGDRGRDDDVITCPACGRSNDRDARRCYHCGERLTTSPSRSRSRSRYPDRDDYDDDHGYRHRRRDTEPHRAGMVLAMGIISLVGIAVIWGVPIIFGIIGWVMGQTDLRKMRNNQRDSDGQGMTKAGGVCSIIGTLLNGAMILFCCGFIGFVIWGESANRPRTTRTAVPFTVPTKQQMDKGWNPNPPGGQK
jgi:hypothetical protein